MKLAEELPRELPEEEKVATPPEAESEKLEPREEPPRRPMEPPHTAIKADVSTSEGRENAL